jgi:hypothetical protein
MSDDASFLSRWSRLKRTAQPQPAPEPAAPQEPGAPGEPVAAPAAVQGSGPEPEFDLASLPPVEEITAETDVTGFLRRGVPADLRRDALRRAWAADPVIRDFVGLADYDWDFNGPGGNQVYGPLDPTLDVARMAEQILGLDRKKSVPPESELTDLSAQQPEVSAPLASLPESQEKDMPAQDRVDVQPASEETDLGCGAAKFESLDESLRVPLSVGMAGKLAPVSAPSHPQNDRYPGSRRRRHGNALPAEK